MMPQGLAVRKVSLINVTVEGLLSLDARRRVGRQAPDEDEEKTRTVGERCSPTRPGQRPEGAGLPAPA
jgi:hypothetical protein